MPGMIIRSLILILFISPAWAGFYVGAGGGPAVANFAKDAQITQINPTTGGLSFNATDKTHNTGTGLFGSIFGGYGCFFPGIYGGSNNLYWGIEANANASSVAFKSSNQEFVHLNFSQTRFKLGPSYGLSFLPGFLWNCTLFYGRLGYVKGNFQIITSDTSLSNISTYRDATRYGLGIKQMLTQRLAVRMEYSHTSYNSVSRLVVDNSSGTPTTKLSVISPYLSQVEFGLVYSC